MKIRLALAALAMAAVAAPAEAQTVRAADPMTVVEALRSAGYPAQIGDEGGNPKIDTIAGSTSFIVYFLDCTNGRDCRSMQFHSSYDTPAPPLETINRWNRDTRYARAYVLPDGNPALEMDLGLDNDSGMSRRLFLAHLGRYVFLLPQFERLIGWGRQ